MPLYEYRCEECSRRFTLLIGVVAQRVRSECPRCGSERLQKLISRFAIARSEDAILDDLADPSALGDPDDPRALADWMRRAGRELGEDLGDDFNALVEEAIHEEAAPAPHDFPVDSASTLPTSNGTPAASETTADA